MQTWLPYIIYLYYHHFFIRSRFIMLSILILDFETAVVLLQFAYLLLKLFQFLLGELLVHHEVLLPQGIATKLW